MIDIDWGILAVAAALGLMFSYCAYQYVVARELRSVIDTLESED